VGILSRLVVVLAFPRERQLGHFRGQAQTECTVCTTRHDGHFGVEWGTVIAEIGIESGMPIVRP
jgi:hypothetical protein